MADDAATPAVRRPASAGPRPRASDLFWGVAAVLVAIVAERLAQANAASHSGAHGKGYQIAHGVTVGVLVVVALGCLLVVARQWSLMRRSTTGWRSLTMSAAVGAFLLVSAALVVSFTEILATGTTLVGGVVVVCSVGLGLIALFQIGAQTMTSEPTALPVAPDVAEQLPLPGGGRRRPIPPRPEPIFPMPMQAPTYSDQAPLPPLFGDDPLYAVPTPRSVQLFIHPKGSGSPVECDDACALDEQNSVFALCDGTGSSALPRPWAALLARAWVGEPFVDQPDGESLDGWLDPLRQQWRQWARDTWLPTLNDRYAQLGEALLPEQRADDVIKVGASSTFLGLRIVEDPHERTINWQSIAIGDTCMLLFQRDDKHLRPALSFPLDHSSVFNDRPPSLPTRQVESGALAAQFQARAGVCNQGDALVMATDALSKWILASIEQGDNGWRALLDNRDPAWFDAFVERERATGAIEDDDTTLLVIWVNGPYPQESLSLR